MRVTCELSSLTASNRTNHKRKNTRHQTHLPSHPKHHHTTFNPTPLHIHKHTPYKHTHTHSHALTRTRVVGGHLRTGSRNGHPLTTEGGACVCHVNGAAKQPPNQTNHKSKITRHQTHQVIQNTTTPHTTPHRFTHSHFIQTHTMTHTHTCTPKPQDW